MSDLHKHSLVVAGHHTSVTLEDAFWTALRGMAEAEGISMNELVTRIDEARQGNLSSALRVYVLEQALDV